MTQGLIVKNILVTGGAGFIGSNFVTNQINSGHNIIVYDAFTYAGNEINLKDVKDRCNIIKADIKDQDYIYKILCDEKIDYLINFAAESHVDNSIEAPSIFIETNIIGTYNLLSASLKYYNNLLLDKKNNFRYLQISTDEVYGSLSDTGKFTEDSRIMPNSPYSASKASGDLLARAWYETYNLPVIITNCSNNYGPRQLPEKFIPVVIFAAIEDRKIPIYGDGKNVRDWIHVEDHVEGLNLALSKGKAGQTYCFGGNSEITNIELVKNICNILDEILPRSDKLSYNNQISFIEDRLGHDRRYAIDDSKATEQLGFDRKYSFKDGIRETIKWYLENKEWHEIIARKMKNK